ncbi:hypothetical protein FHS29_002586 [Saccharothrix tamanrassetensis]|uniref:Uncharacterized protein n=1 Tax=Saccharothrix tamanrassetensis TaxID=1051531 RepID=A0A841CJ21_9PSEU|nr:hypothetical protein [Saccharothrix tamanrassetensis]MBB5956005.1 hypothetical protein [Saccharothrix tamanrassetensis]
MTRSSLLSLVVSTALGVVIVADDNGDWTGFGTWGLPACALVYLVVGLARGFAKRPRVLAVQAAGVPAFTGLALAALSLAPEVGRYVVAAGWLAHAAWDLVHYRARLVVPRWYALACVVVDTFVGVSLVW